MPPPSGHTYTYNQKECFMIYVYKIMIIFTKLTQFIAFINWRAYF